MDRIEEFDIINQAVKHYGADAQLDKAIEECCELARAIARYKNSDLYNSTIVEENLLEEMADVGIMIDQLRIIAGASEEEQREVKLKRLRERIEKCDTTTYGASDVDKAFISEAYNAVDPIELTDMPLLLNDVYDAIRFASGILRGRGKKGFGKDGLYVAVINEKYLGERVEHFSRDVIDIDYKGCVAKWGSAMLYTSALIPEDECLVFAQGAIGQNGTMTTKLFGVLDKDAIVRVKTSSEASGASASSHGCASGYGYDR